MNYKFINIIILSLFLFGCDQSIYKSNKKSSFKIETKYRNIGFALVNNDENKIDSLEDRSLEIYHKTLKRKSIVKITNLKNGKSLIVKVKSNKTKFSKFYNSLISLRIAEDLELDLREPYVELVLVSKNSTFVAKKSKTFEEEREVAEKAPVDGIQINDLNNNTFKPKTTDNSLFSYSIKIADFYYKQTAEIMLDKIKLEASLENLKIVELSKTKYRVLIGPFNDIKSIKDSFEKIESFNFENLEVLKNV